MALASVWVARRGGGGGLRMVRRLWSYAWPYRGRLAAALGAIRARAVVMPSRTDLYFPPEDNEIEVAQMPNAELRIIPSIRGHLAGGGGDPEDRAWVSDQLAELLAR